MINLHDKRRKLTGEQEYEIKISTQRTTRLAKQYGVSAARISQIRLGRIRNKSNDYQH